MKVRLKRNFFSTDGKLYRAVRGEATEMPSTLFGQLPKDAKIEDKKFLAEEEKIKAKAAFDVKAKVAASAQAVANAAKADAEEAEAAAESTPEEDLIEVEESTADACGPGFDEMTIPQLKDFAKAVPIDLRGAKTKDDIIAVLTAKKSKSAEVDALLGQ